MIPLFPSLSRRRLPVILQAEKGECGLACLAMIAIHFGMKTDLNNLRLLFPVGGSGSTLNGIVGISESLRLATRAIRLEARSLDRLGHPAMLHWDMNHFVVLAAITGSHAIIHDPAVGRRRYTLEELARHFTGVALEFIPRKDFPVPLRPRINRLADLFPFSRAFWLSAAQVLLLSIAMQAIALVSPFYVQITVDQGLGRNDPDLILLIAIAFLFLALGKTAISHLRGTILLFFSNRLGFQMADSVFRHLIRLPGSYFENRQTGEIVSRFEATGQIRQLVTNDMITVIVDGLLSLSTLVALFIYSPLLSTITLVLLSSFILIRLVLMPAERQLRHEFILADARQQSVFLDNIRSIPTTRIYGLEKSRTADWQNGYATMLNSGIDLGRLQNRLNSLQILIFGIDHVATLYFGTLLIYQAELSIGQLIGFVFLKQHFINAVNSMIPKLVEIRLLRLQLERLSDITFCEKESELEPCSISGRLSAVNLAVRHLSFRYPGARYEVLHELSFELAQGEFLAVTGVSGCGKSTLLRVMTGLEQTGGQHLFINGQALDEFGLAEYRRHIAASLHSDSLIMGSIHYNITLGTYSGMSVERACELACVDEDIQRLPMQFNTLVGDMTNTLSAGQLQRILLARAIYRQPAILFIDEGFSNLNDALATRILGSLRSLGMSVVLVTHNPLLIDCMDRTLSLSPAARISRSPP